MKNFREYLAETENTYNYRIKMVGDVNSDFINEFENKLSQFDLVKVTKAKTTPVQKSPANFPAFPNESVTSMDIVVKYPAIEPQIKQIAQLLGMDPNRIVMQATAFDDSMENEAQEIDKNKTGLLANTDYPAPNEEQKAASKDYAAAPEDHAVLQNQYRSKFTIAGGKTPAAKTTNELPMGDKSPMSKMTRPARPKTGKQPQG